LALRGSVRASVGTDTLTSSPRLACGRADCVQRVRFHGSPVTGKKPRSAVILAWSAGCTAAVRRSSRDRWFHEVEVIDDANPGSVLYKIASEARALGADGVQFLELIDLKPQSPGEKVSRQIDSAVRLADKAQRGRLTPGDVASEGSETRWEVRGELVRFVDHPASANN
jgi:hypothetical protein